MSAKLFTRWGALNVAPAHVTSFIFTSPEKQAVEYSKQADGGWKAATTDQRAGPTVYFNETELTITPAEGDAKKMSFPVAEAMGLKKGIAWQTVELVPFGRARLKIQRQADGFDLIFDSAEPPTTNNTEQRYTIRWKEGAVKGTPR